MRYTLFGRGEGVRVDCDHPQWACVDGDRVSDATVSARLQGVRPGISAGAAQALVPGIVLCEDEPSSSQTIETVWRMLWDHTPWLETVGKDSFILQVAGPRPPLREVRDILLRIDQELPVQSRFRVGFAETPRLARALVEWSECSCGRIPGAGYYTVGRQQLIVSPGLAVHGTTRKPVLQRSSQTRPVEARTAEERTTQTRAAEAPPWILNLPIQALWMLPQQTRDTLSRLGVHRLADLLTLPEADLINHFGRESLLWKQWFAESPPGRICVNYPPLQHRQVWQARAGETMHPGQLPELLKTLLTPIAVELNRAGAGALRLGLVWQSERGEARFERIAKAPVHRLDSLVAQLAEGVDACVRTAVETGGLERMEVYVADLRPFASSQSAFVLKNGLLLPATDVVKEEVGELLTQVNGRFPDKLRLGMRGAFRELRWRAVAEG
jgi:hypothetical protein